MTTHPPEFFQKAVYEYLVSHGVEDILENKEFDLGVRTCLSALHARGLLK